MVDHLVLEHKYQERLSIGFTIFVDIRRISSSSLKMSKSLEKTMEEHLIKLKNKAKSSPEAKGKG